MIFAWCDFYTTRGADTPEEFHDRLDVVADWLTTAREQFVPTEGSSLRTVIASAFH